HYGLRTAFDFGSTTVRFLVVFCPSSLSTNAANSLSRRRLSFMPRTGFEPARLAALPPQSSASANSATWAMGSELYVRVIGCRGKLRGYRDRRFAAGRVIMRHIVIVS